MILITGSSGLLGSNMIIAALRRGQDVTAGYHVRRVRFPGVPDVALDLTRPGQLESAVAAVRPDWILHGAAATNVDWCEDHPDEARLINTEASRQLARVAGARRARLLYVSTDAVFDGHRGGYTETDPAAPVNVYGSTKWEGEKAVRDVLPASLVVRTNFYGWNALPKQSLPEWVLGRLESGQEVAGFKDVVFTPILVDDLADILLTMMDRSLQGLYHVAGSEALTKYEFAKRVANVFGHPSRSIRSISIDDAGLRAPRPRNTALRTEKIMEALGRAMPSVDEGLHRFKHARDSGYASELKASVRS